MKFSAGGALIVAAVIYLTWSGMSESTAYFLTVSEAVRYESLHRGEPVRVKGRVGEGSINWDPREQRLRFRLADNEQQILVLYRGIAPDLFGDGREVIVEGRLTSAVLAARTILTSCPSKYEPQDTAAVSEPP